MGSLPEFRQIEEVIFDRMAYLREALRNPTLYMNCPSKNELYKELSELTKQYQSLIDHKKED